MDLEWFRGVLDLGHVCLGEALMWARNVCPHGDDTWKYCLLSLNLLGDPAMPIWTDSMRNLVVTYDSTLAKGPSLFDIHVENDEGGPVDSAYVCLWKGPEVYERGYTNGSGDLSLYVDAAGPGEILVTVTKHNFLPHEGTAEVEPFNFTWEAASGQLPDEFCPASVLYNDLGTDPAFDADTLVITTIANNELMYYYQQSPDISMPDTIAVEARMKFVLETSGAEAYEAAEIGFWDGASDGNFLKIAKDTIYLLTGPITRGPLALVDTDDDFHTYRVTVLPTGTITVSYDGTDTLTGATYSGSLTSTILWGDQNDVTSGVSKWLWFKHNAYAFDFDTDEDGIIDSCDNCPTAFNPDQEDDDLDGVGDSCDNCITIFNPDQADNDSDSQGNLCDICPEDPENDIDGGGICADIDKCPDVYDPDQLDFDGDDIGDACEVTFTRDSLTTVGVAYPVTIEAADLNFDNRADLVFSSALDGTVSVSLGSGDGTFEDPITLITGDGSPMALTIAFIDNDGTRDYPDVVAADMSAVYVLTDPGLGNTVYSTHSYSGDPGVDLAQGRVDDDTFIDIIVTPNHIFYGDGLGGIKSTDTLPFSFKSVDVADFDGDGYDDLLLGIDHAKASNDSASIFLNDGLGGFTVSAGVALGDVDWTTPLGNVIADLDHDGDLDFAFAAPLAGVDSTRIFVVQTDGTGQVAEVDTIEVDGLAARLATADFDRDGALDILASIFRI